MNKKRHFLNKKSFTQICVKQKNELSGKPGELKNHFVNINKKVKNKKPGPE